MKLLFNKKMHPLIVVTALTILVITTFICIRHNSETVAAFSMPCQNKVIILDAGHGGWDPGMVGEKTILEKDLNLKIAEKLQHYLELGGAIVINTRTIDEALGDRKRSDMLARKEIANSLGADLLISIHQNSYTDEDIRGAQVFYFNKSESGKLLAQSIQNEIKEFIQPNNKRKPKADASYYMLTRSEVPSVIIECGFLSNPDERKNLADDEYQEKMAWSIYKGMISFFETWQQK